MLAMKGDIVKHNNIMFKAISKVNGYNHQQNVDVSCNYHTQRNYQEVSFV